MSQNWVLAVSSSLVSNLLRWLLLILKINVSYMNKGPIAKTSFESAENFKTLVRNLPPECDNAAHLRSK